MSRRVQLDGYGSVDQLHIAEVPIPTPGPGQVLVRVLAAGINPGESRIRRGELATRFPSTFPSGQGSDVAGLVVAAAPDADGAPPVGSEVMGWSDERSSQADHVALPAAHVIVKPPTLDFYRAGSMFVAGTTAYAAVRSLRLNGSDTLAVSGAAGGVGFLAVQLAARTGARVIGIAGQSSAAYLRSVGVDHVAYGDGLADRLRDTAPSGITAFLDTHGSGYVELALSLGVHTSRIDTIADFAAVDRFGVRSVGNAEGSSTTVLSAIAELVAWGAVRMPVAAVYPLQSVREAYTELDTGHTHGKIVLSTELPEPLRPDNR